MRFGCCGNLVATGPDKTGIEIVETIAAQGYDYIELPLAEMMALSEEEFAALCKRVEQSGIRCETCNNFFPAHIRLTGPDVDMEKIESYARKALARAATLGAEIVVFGSGTAKTVPEGFDFDTAYQQVVDITKLVAPIAAENNILLVIEPIRVPECNIINSFAEGVELAKQVDHPNVKVLIDYYHMVWEKEDPAILRTYGRDYLRHCHFAFPNLGSDVGRLYPSNMQEWDYLLFIQILKEIGYTDRVSLEAGVLDFVPDAKAALAFLQENF